MRIISLMNILMMFREQEDKFCQMKKETDWKN